MSACKVSFLRLTCLGIIFQDHFQTLRWCYVIGAALVLFFLYSVYTDICMYQSVSIVVVKVSVAIFLYKHWKIVDLVDYISVRFFDLHVVFFCKFTWFITFISTSWIQFQYSCQGSFISTSVKFFKWNLKLCSLQFCSFESLEYSVLFVFSL